MKIPQKMVKELTKAGKTAIAGVQSAINKLPPQLRGKTATLAATAVGGAAVMKGAEVAIDHIFEDGTADYADPRDVVAVLTAAAKSGVDVSGIVKAVSEIAPAYASYTAGLGAMQAIAATAEGPDELSGSFNDAARDLVRRKKVEAMLSVFGSFERYALAQGVTEDDIRWYNIVVRGR